MGLFSKCSRCGKRMLSFFIGSDGVCSDCHTAIWQQKGAEIVQQAARKQNPQRRDVEKFNVSSLVKQADSGYIPLPSTSDEPTYVFIDVETTGLSPTKDAIVQVSALRFFGKKVIDGLNSYVNPLRPIPAASTAIHGISDAKVKDSPTIDEIKEPFLKLIEGAILVGHNATFDLNFLDHAFHGALDGFKYIDTLEIAKALLDLPNYKLETVADYAEFYPEGGYHDSLTDCTATAAIFFRLSFNKPDYAKVYCSQPSEKKDCSFSPKDAPSTPTNTYHPLYGKKIVFAGKLSITHKEAARLATDVGAIVRSTVTGKTDYLVLGDGDTSRQEDKADDLFLEGNTLLQVICEREFMNLLQGRDRFSAKSIL